VDITLLLGISAGLLHIVAYALYNKQMLEKTSQPNSATWITWVFLTVLNASSYRVMSGDLVECILPMSSSVLCILTFFFSLYKGRLSKIDRWDGISLGIGIISGLVWWRHQSATYANLIMQLAFAVSFIPMYRGVWKDPKKEKALPWYLWSSAFAISAIVVVLRWDNKPLVLVYPINGFIFHAVIGLLTKRRCTWKRTNTVYMKK
jgi:hypothetical protein